MKKIICMSLLFAMSLSFAACAENNAGTKGDSGLEVDASLSMNIYDENKKISVKSTSDQAVSFACDSDVVTVLQDGTVIANKFGSATVTVSCGSTTKTCVVTVRETDAIPVVSLLGITGNEIDLVAGDAFALDYSATVEGYSVNAEYDFESSNDAIFTVSEDGVLVAESTGNAYLTVTCEYKIWEVEQVYDVTVLTDTVVKLSQNKLTLSATAGVPGNEVSKKVECLGVYEDGVAVENATVTWESMDESVATVADGVITAVGVGKTYVKAIYNDGERIVNAYVLVTVAYPTLEKPTNFAVEGDMLVWDEVVGADGYIVFDGTYEVKTEQTSLKLSDLNPANNYFSSQNFYVSAYSNTDGVKASENAVCNKVFETLSYTDRIAKADNYEANVKTYNGQDFVADVPIYHATCTGTAIPGKPDIYGYLFKKVYFTQKAYDVYGGPTGSHGSWCNKSLLNPAKVSNFYNSKISFWVYAEKEITIMYVKMNQNWDRTIIAKQTIPADTWTNVAFSISQNDFPYITMLSSTGDFYFTDFRISELTYETKDYSDIDKGVERVANVVAAIDGLPAASQVPATMEFGDSVRAIRNEYETLSNRRKGEVSNYDKLVAVESAYGSAVYEQIKSDAAVTSLLALVEDYNASYNGVSMDVFNTYETKATAITNVVNQLNSMQYYAVNYADPVYMAYVANRSEYKVIDIATSNVKEVITASSAISATANGWVEINNMMTAPNVASALKHPVYGYVATMGTNPRENTVIMFNDKENWSLAGYTHIMLAVKNPRAEKLSVYLYENGGRVKMLAENIAKAENYDEYATVIVSIEDFMKYDISFGYDGMPNGTGSIWLTQLIAIKVEDSQLDAVNELHGMLEELGGEITLESGALLASARALYDGMTSAQKSFVKNVSVLIAAEEKYQVLLVEDKIAKIGSVSATEECLQKIFAARTAYDALTEAQMGMVSNYETLTAAETAIRAMVTPDATAQAVIDEIQAFLNGFSGVSPKNFVSVQAQIKAIDESVQGLTAMQKYSLTNYDAYLEAKNSFLVVDDLTGTDIASRFKYNGNGTGINNGETAPNVAAALNDPVYGPVATIGKAGGGLDLKYIATNGLNLNGYTHVIFAMKNRLSVPIDIRNSTTGDYYVKNVAVDEWAIVAMTVKEFTESGVSVWINGTGSIWISPIIAVTMDNSYDDVVAEYNAMIEEILSSEVTTATATKINEAKAMYNQLPELNKLWAKDISVLANVEKALETVMAIDGIGEVQATMECIENIQAVRAAYDALTDTQKALVSNYETLTAAEESIRAMTTPDATAQAVIDEIQAFLDGFGGVTPKNYLSVQAQINAIDESVQGLTALQQYSLTNYEDYLAAKNSFKVIDALRDGTVAELKAKFTWVGEGYNSINNGITAPNVASALKHATYGDFITIGKGTPVLRFKYNVTGVSLDGYTHVTFVMKNGLSSAVSFITSSTKRVLAENVANGAFVTITMTVTEFKNESVMIYTPDNQTESTASGSFWISAIVAIKKSSNVVFEELDAELAKFNAEFPAEITLENYRNVQAKVDVMEEALAGLTATQKASLSNYAAYTAKKSSYKLIDDMSGTDIASRFKMSSGANGINNGETAPAVAATLNDATYGPCATIGKNVGGLDIKYAATEGLDLSGYNYVLIAVKNNLGVSVKIQNSSTGAVYVESVENGKFAVVKMTVSDFLKSGFSIWVNNQGTIWISSIIAVK